MHLFSVRVYYEDTDAGGIVYHANYLKFIERARSEWVRELGIDQGRMRVKEGIGFVVRRLEADFLAPARYDDLLAVETAVRAWSGARLVLDQAVTRGAERLFSAVVTVVCVDASGRAVRLPRAVLGVAAKRAGGGQDHGRDHGITR